MCPTTTSQTATGGDPGLYYLRARYGACPEHRRRNPEIGLFLTRDPFPGYAGLPASQNPYAYVMNNPVNYVDPYGLCGLGSFGDAWDCVKKAGNEAVEFASSNAGTAILCGYGGPAACVTSLLLNPNTRPYVLTGVQILDIAPIPGTPGAVIEALAFAAAQYEILTNDCLPDDYKLALTLSNVINLELGLAAKVYPPLEYFAVPYELANFGTASFALTCTPAAAGYGGFGKEGGFAGAGIGGGGGGSW